MNSHFNFLAPFYDRVIPFARLEQTLKALDLPHAGNLLDAGGGTGREGGAPPIPYEQLIGVTKSIFAVVESLRTGNKVAV